MRTRSEQIEERVAELDAAPAPRSTAARMERARLVIEWQSRTGWVWQE